MAAIRCGESMSGSFSVVFAREVQPYGTLGGDHIAIVDAKRKFKCLAKMNKMRSLDEFESYETVDVADALGIDIGEPGFSTARWFSATEGRAAVRALLALLHSHPDEVPNQADVIEDLTVIESELAV